MGSDCLRDAIGDACDVNGWVNLLLFLLAIVLGKLDKLLLGLLLSLAGRHCELKFLLWSIDDVVQKRLW